MPFCLRFFLSGSTSARSFRTGAGLLLLATFVMVPAFAKVPLPRSRPTETPAREPLKDDAAKGEQGRSPEETEAAKPPGPSACRIALTDSIAVAPSIPPIHGSGGCGGEDLVRLEAVVILSGQRVTLKPPAILRCTMATAIANWVREDAAPLAAKLGSSLAEVDNFDSYECRGRNRVAGAKLSEHGRANALDVRGLRLANGTTLWLTDRHLARETRETVLASVCTRFMTVLGPGSDWYHEDHIHLDLAERRNNYKLCQWGVYDPLPQIAPLMPTDRPAEAPLRSTAETSDKVVTSPPQSSEAGPAEDGDKKSPSDTKVKSKKRPSARPQ